MGLKAGLSVGIAGSLIVLALAAAGGALVRPAQATTQRGFHFDSQTGTPTTSMKKAQILIMVGTGTFEPNGGAAQGGGDFEIFDNTTSVPKTILSSGTWNAVSLVSWTELGTYGVFASGTAVMNIVLTLAGGVHISATLTVVCNIGAAGLNTGMEEGIYVTIGSTSYNPVAGLTIFDVIGSSA